VVRLATWNLGVWEAPAYEPSELIAGFSAAYETFFCPGDEVHFVNHSVCSANATFTWSFPGAAPATSTEPYPTVLYNEAGTYDVTLTVTDGTQSQTVTYTNYISNAEALGGDFVEDFETGGFPESWTSDGDGAWSVTSDASGFGAGLYSMRFDNYYYDAQGARDRIWMGKRSATSNMAVAFDVAYAQYNNTYTDTLALVYSLDCGESWISLWSLGGDDLSTAPDFTDYYVPTDEEWASYSVSLPSSVEFDDVIIAFENRGRYGNVIYVDNINVFSTVSVNDIHSDEFQMSIFPNPACSAVNVSGWNMDKGNYRLQLFDLSGKLVCESSVFSAGSRLEKQWVLPEVASGMYVLSLTSENARVQQPLSIQR
jgi:PKD repeat protein